MNAREISFNEFQDFLETARSEEAERTNILDEAFKDIQEIFRVRDEKRAKMNNVIQFPRNTNRYR